jgi:type II secretory pathway pseudopilin PulG
MRAGEATGASGSEAGYTLVVMLVAVFVVALGLSVAGPTWHEQNRRIQERELMRIGVLYAHALAEFREGAPGSLKTYPKSLDELVLDTRFFGVRRHLRRLYPDPLDPARPWGVVRDIDGYITGVYSQSSDEPVASGTVVLGDIVLPPARRYSDWKFSPPSPSQP